MRELGKMLESLRGPHAEVVPPGVVCTICQEIFTRPYTMQCGHSNCEACLMQWFEQSDRSRGGEPSPGPTCPTCRAVVPHAPAPSHSLRELARFVVDALAAEAKSGTTAGSAHDGDSPENMYTSAFFEKISFGEQLTAVYDSEDDLMRCPACNWEVEDGECPRCHRVFPLPNQGRGPNFTSGRRRADVRVTSSGAEDDDEQDLMSDYDETMNTDDREFIDDDESEASGDIDFGQWAAQAHLHQSHRIDSDDDPGFELRHGEHLDDYDYESESDGQGGTHLVSHLTRPISGEDIPEVRAQRARQRELALSSDSAGRWRGRDTAEDELDERQRLMYSAITPIMREMNRGRRSSGRRNAGLNGTRRVTAIDSDSDATTDSSAFSEAGGSREVGRAPAAAAAAASAADRQRRMQNVINLVGSSSDETEEENLMEEVRPRSASGRIPVEIASGSEQDIDDSEESAVESGINDSDYSSEAHSSASEVSAWGDENGDGDDHGGDDHGGDVNSDASSQY